MLLNARPYIETFSLARPRLRIRRKSCRQLHRTMYVARDDGWILAANSLLVRSSCTQVQPGTIKLTIVGRPKVGSRLYLARLCATFAFLLVLCTLCVLTWLWYTFCLSELSSSFRPRDTRDLVDAPWKFHWRHQRAREYGRYSAIK